MSDFAGSERQARGGLALRVVLVAGGLGTLGIAAGFLLGWPLVTRYWPFPVYGLTRVFLASIFAAIGAPVVWIGLSGELTALRGGALNIVVTAGGMAAYCLWRSWGASGGATQIFGLINMVVAIAAAILFVFSRRLVWSNDRSMPGLVRVSFLAFALVLAAAGVALLLNLDVFPWPLDKDTAVIYGLFFLGSAVYFTIGLTRPLWGNAKGQLIGFIAYDLVLLVPFIQLWPKAPSLSLAVYLAVLIYSFALCVWYLLLSPRWRLWAAR
jgi:hypothetical protein